MLRAMLSGCGFWVSKERAMLACVGGGRWVGGLWAQVGVDWRVGSGGKVVRLFGEGLQLELEGSLPWPLPPKLEGERDTMG